MNDNIKTTLDGLMPDTSAADIEKIAEALIKKCAELTDSWGDSGKFLTFGDRLMAHFGVEKK